MIAMALVLRPGAAHRRRADHRPRRHRPGADPRPDPGSAEGVRLRGHHDHPRPRRGRRDGRRRPGDVRRPRRRAWHRRNLFQARSTPTRGACWDRCPVRQAADRPPAADQGHPAQPDQGAAGMPLQPEVRLPGARRLRCKVERPDLEDAADTPSPATSRPRERQEIWTQELPRGCRTSPETPEAPNHRPADAEAQDTPAAREPLLGSRGWSSTSRSAAASCSARRRSRLSTVSTSTYAAGRRSRSSASPAAARAPRPRLVTRLLEPTGGKVTFEGHDITHLPTTGCDRSGVTSR